MAFKTIGTSQKRLDALDKVLGTADYSGDLSRPDQLIMKMLFAGRPHAIVKSIDTTAAQALNGVLLVLTAKDVPNNQYGLANTRSTGAVRSGIRESNMPIGFVL